MNTNEKPKIKNWTTVVGSVSMYEILHGVAVKLSLHGPVQLVDCGNRFSNWLVGQELKGYQTILDYIQIKRVTSAQGLLRLLERYSPATRVAGTADADLRLARPAADLAMILILDLLRPFYDDSIPEPERKRILGECLEQVSRLEKRTSGMIYIQAPSNQNRIGLEMLETVMSVVEDRSIVKMVIPVSDVLLMGA